MERAVSVKTRAILVASPNNPTGQILSAAAWTQLAALAEKHDLALIVDAAYEQLSWKPLNFKALRPYRHRVIFIGSFSKTYAMTGWRLGYAAGPAFLIEQMTKIHQYTIMCAPTNSQYAAIEAMKNGDRDIEEMRESYDQRRRYLLRRFEDMGLPCFEPHGAFYCFPNIKRFGMTSEEFCQPVPERGEGGRCAGDGVRRVRRRLPAGLLRLFPRQPPGGFGPAGALREAAGSGAAGMNVVLHQPEMPANTGNIGRTCTATGTRLHLICPLGFRLDEKSLKRAGLDYWKELDVTVYDNFEDFLEKNPGAKIYMRPPRTEQVYTEWSTSRTAS